MRMLQVNSPRLYNQGMPRMMSADTPRGSTYTSRTYLYFPNCRLMVTMWSAIKRFPSASATGIGVAGKLCKSCRLT